MTRIAVDAMGGDNAPGEIVAGAAQAHTEHGLDVVLVGRAADLEKACADAGAQLPIVDAPEVVAMDHPDPARAVRSTRSTSSIALASKLVADGEADAVFSAGSTGAALAAAVMTMGRIRGVPRPAIALVLPFPGAATVLVDAGANVDVRPEHMAGFAVLGSVLAETTLGLESPRVGLLSVGEEPGKGNELVKAAYPLLEGAGVNFIGNVEGRDIATPAVDVVVTDGFTGNVVLKLLEGFGRFLFDQLLGVFTATEEAKAAAKVLMPGLLELADSLSPDSHGGAQLVGVKGVCIIGHGSSNARSVSAALGVAAQTADGGLVPRIAERLSTTKGQ